MPTVGRFVTDPRTGARCQVTLDDGEQVVVNHANGDVGGGLLTIERETRGGRSSERVFRCDLDTPEGQELRRGLVRGAEPGTTSATPLWALVQFVKSAGTLAELRSRCAKLALAGRAAADPANPYEEASGWLRSK
jgi:hypothetical protein